MVVGIGKIKFKIHDSRSLKAKRSIVKSIIGHLRNKFNASVAEVGLNDAHQIAEIGFAIVGNDKSVINSAVDKIFNVAEELGLAELFDSEMEIIAL
ncbi:MAG: DUF503 domain-containing protein [Desulfobacterales bacterium]|nr:DUF503 domain-containing protein [Desulfobacterales bacterium]